MKNYQNISHHDVLISLSNEFQPYSNCFISNEESELLMDVCFKIGGNILEIGTHTGKTTTNIARVAKEKGGKVITIDVTEPPLTITGAQNPGECLLPKLIGSDIPDEYRNLVDIKLINPNVPNALSDLMNSLNMMFDVIFIDGDHSFYGCLIDYEVVKSYLSKNGVILFHDVWWDVDPMPVDGPLRVLDLIGGCILNKTHIGIPKDLISRIT